jgi:hypothetical protein
MTAVPHLNSPGNVPAFRTFAIVGWLLTAWTMAVFVLGFLVVRWVATNRPLRLGSRR